MFERFKIEKRLKGLEDSHSVFERRLTALEVQWMDTLDRLKQMMGRVLKERQRAEAARQESDSSTQDEAEADVGASTLSQRQQEINARIWARRNRLGKEQ